MKIFGAVLAILYAGLMVFAICKEKSKSAPAVSISMGCFLILLYTLLNLAWSMNFIAMMIIGMLCISAGTLMNGFKQNSVHIHHHVIRLIVESIITVICWIGG